MAVKINNHEVDTDNNVFLSDKDLSKRYKVARQSVWRWVAAGKFPAPVRLTVGCSRWRLSDVTHFEASRQ